MDTLMKIVNAIPANLAKLILVAILAGGGPVVYALNSKVDRHKAEADKVMAVLSERVQAQTDATHELTAEIRTLREMLAQRALDRGRQK
jgi:ribose 1,5-bisphosphokinase PhnN